MEIVAPEFIAGTYQVAFEIYDESATFYAAFQCCIEYDYRIFGQGRSFNLMYEIYIQIYVSYLTSVYQSKSFT